MLYTTDETFIYCEDDTRREGDRIRRWKAATRESAAAIVAELEELRERAERAEAEAAAHLAQVHALAASVARTPLELAAPELAATMQTILNMVEGPHFDADRRWSIRDKARAILRRAGRI